MNIIILAAGKGKRMKSDLPKVLFELQGKPLIHHVLEKVAQLDCCDHGVVVIGHKKELVIKAIQNFNVDYVVQKEQRGTGHAVECALDLINANDPETLVLCGDVPLISIVTIRNLINEHRQTKARATVLTAKFDDPGSYGRIIRGKDKEVTKIVEFKDASAEEKEVKEINSGSFVFDTQTLKEVIQQLEDNNAQKEFYLTDTLELIRKRGERVSAYCVEDNVEINGVNSVQDLADLEAHLAKTV